MNKQGQETVAVNSHKQEQKDEWQQTDREGEEERVARHTNRVGLTDSCWLPPGKRGEQRL